MTNLMHANKQWSSRPDDERFLSLLDMKSHFDHLRDHSKEIVISSNAIEAKPTDDNRGLVLVGADAEYGVSHWAFGQMAQLAEAPAGYLRTLPSPIAADCINYGLRYKRSVEDVGCLLYKNGGDPLMRAATGPKYGRIWNTDVLAGLIQQFGDGVNGMFKVPGIRGQALEMVTKDNTTLYAGDRDMFIFLADEENRIEMPNRRNGQTGSLAKGFFVWNSEVGSSTFGIATFLFDFVCANRIVWGAEEFKEITIRHTSGAPAKFIHEIAPQLESYSNADTQIVTQVINNAQKAKIDDVDEFLAKRFSKKQVQAIQQAHMDDENRPIETLWDATTGITAWARTIHHQDARVSVERKAGAILDMAA